MITIGILIIVGSIVFGVLMTFAQSMADEPALHGVGLLVYLLGPICGLVVGALFIAAKFLP